jgi:AcrR family transcriptional regulator
MSAKISKQKTKKRLPGRPIKDMELRAGFIAAARKLFAEQGFEKTSTREIAKAAGGNLALIAYYFGSKEELLQAILQEHAEQIHAQYPAPILEGIELNRSTFIQVMRGIMALQLMAFQAEPEIMLIVERELLDGAARSKKIIEGLLQQMLEQLIAVIQEGKRLGYVKPQVHETTFLMLLARSISGYFFLHRQLQGKVNIASQIIDPNQETESFLAQVELAFLSGILIEEKR